MLKEKIEQQFKKYQDLHVLFFFDPDGMSFLTRNAREIYSIMQSVSIAWK